MTTWLLRGLAFGFAMIVLRVVQGTLIDAYETKAGTISVVLMAIYAVVAFILGFFDGRGDARKQADPDRRADLSMVWLVAGLIAGALSGAVCWLIHLFYKNLYSGGLINELTVFAAFTALVTFLMALFGVTLGRFLVDRKAPPPPKHEHSHERHREENTDTDVFAAVGGDRTRAREETTAREATTDREIPRASRREGEGA